MQNIGERIPSNDHPIRTDHIFGGCLQLAEVLGDKLPELSSEDQAVVMRNLYNAFDRRVVELAKRIREKRDLT